MEEKKRCSIVLMVFLDTLFKALRSDDFFVKALYQYQALLNFFV